MNTQKKLIRYYASGYENYRLHQDNTRQIEYLTTIHYFDELLPKGTAVLDCCAGCGVYSFYLAEKGFKVTATDLTPSNIKDIKSNEKFHLLHDAKVLNVLDMHCFADESFDIVLCMGAYYHLLDAEDRKTCVSECLRVLKKNGILVLAYINRNATVLYRFLQNPKEIQKLQGILKTGHNDLFYNAAFDEIKNLTEKFGLTKIKNIGVDGAAYPLQKQINSLSKKQFQAYMQYHLSVCEEPSITGNSMHGLLFAQKP